MRPFLTLLLAPLALMACEDPDTRDVSVGVPEGAPAVEPQGTDLAGVDLTGDLRLLGTEPFWGVDLTDGRIVYSGVDRPEQTAERPAPVMAGTTATWTTTTSTGAEMVVTLIETPCSDGMSDRIYPLTARVVIGEETLDGCAATPAAIAAAGESGAV